MSVPRERFATADVRSALYARLSLAELPATDWYRPRHQPADRDRPRAAVGGRPTTGRGTSRRRQHAADLPMSNLSGGGLHPVRTPRTAARPWRHARPAPRAWGRPWRACSGSSRDVGSHLRSVARFEWQCVQRLARCRKSCAVVSATSPEALRGRWHCLASDSSRES
jgi:hypothetical protein